MPEARTGVGVRLAEWQRLDDAAFLAERALELMVDCHRAGAGRMPTPAEFAVARRLRTMAAAQLLGVTRQLRLRRTAQALI